jgi:uncharacterized protein
MNAYQRIATGLHLKPQQVETVVQLLQDGSTVPFIARYRKDRTGALDEVQIQAIQEQYQYQQNLDARRQTILQSIEEQGKLTPELKKLLEEAESLTVLEDLYLPYKPKRRTRGQIAKEKGLEPLAEALVAVSTDVNVDQLVQTLLSEEVKTLEDAFQGARDIVAEWINEDASVRERMRKLFEADANLVAAVNEEKKDAAAKYQDYFAFREPIRAIPAHRILAVLRGFMEGLLSLRIAPEEEQALQLIDAVYVQGCRRDTREHLEKAARDAYKRLLQPSLETEYRTKLKEQADEEAIQVFAENLRQLLLSAPLGNKRVLAIDPGYRTGGKVVCLDETGILLDTSLIFPHEQNRRADAGRIVGDLVRNHAIQAIAVGDGTAGRETEQFLRELSLGLPIFLVNEDGASVYSASAIAREEFPDQDVTVRGAVSIGRRLMDPLAELVKIDPKSLGVGQYQHDVNPFRLKEKLDTTVSSCVNHVGVNLNTASKSLLSYVSGIGPGLAEQIVKHRQQIGRFVTRKQLLDVPRLGPKAFEQAAGFLRIKGGTEPLDDSAVHPEVYPLVNQLAGAVGKPLADMLGKTDWVKQVDTKRFVSETIGLHTIQDVLQELQKPGLDPRPEATQFEFAAVYKIEDLMVGMVVPGMVTNITRFGAFVDIGVKQDGLVHVSEIAHRYISDPAEVLKLQQQVQVKVLEVDLARKRIQLSIKQTQERAAGQKSAGPVRRPQHQHGTQSKEERSLGDALAGLHAKFGRR